MVLLVVAVIVWKPRDSIIYPLKRWKPRYRSLGVPPPVPSYIRYDVDNWPDKMAYVAWLDRDSVWNPLSFSLSRIKVAHGTVMGYFLQTEVCFW